MDQAPLATPWASIGLMVLGLALFYAAAAIDTGPPVRFRRALTRLLVLLSGASLVGAVVSGVLSP